MEQHMGNFIEQDSLLKSENQDKIYYELTDSQKEIWLAAQFGDIASCAFNEIFILSLNGPVSIQNLENAINKLLSRHEAFKMRFHDNGTFSIANDIPSIHLQLEDLSSLSEEKRSERIGTIIDRQSLTPFDLKSSPLIRPLIIKLGNDSYQLIVTAHHLIMDGWSRRVFLDELSMIYSSLVNNSELLLAEPDSFIDYHKSLIEDVNSKSSSSSADYWKKLFSSVPAPLNLPTDNNRPAAKSFNGDTSSITLSQEDLDLLTNASKNLKVTLHSFLFSTFYVLLNRLANQSDLVIGIPSSGQAISGMKSLIGDCVMLLPIRVATNEDNTFEDLVKLAKSNILDAYDNSQFTYGKILQEIAVKRDIGRQTLVEVLFDVSQSTKNLRFFDISSKCSTGGKKATNFDLFLHIENTTSDITLHCDFNTDLFQKSTIDRWMKHLKVIITSVISNPLLKISEIPLMNHTELNTILTVWNSRDSKYPQCKVAHLFEMQVSKTPEKIAVIWKNNSFTYNEINQRANQLANLLLKRGISPEKIVGLFLDRSVDTIIAMLGVLKAGGAYLPLDPDFPLQRIEYMIAHSRTEAIITKESLKETLLNSIQLPSNLNLICIDSEKDTLVKESTSNPPDKGTITDLAYLLYTSGSTGKPKGVQITNTSLVNFLFSMKKEPGINETDILLSVTTTSFDISGLEIYLPLISGATTFIAPRECVLDPFALINIVNNSGITIMQATPSTWKMMLEAGWKSANQLKILCGGEALTAKLAKELLEIGADLWNMYGPTETTIWSTIHHCKFSSELAPPIGKPIDNTYTYIIDKYMQPVPIGVTGELLIGGKGLARGYLFMDDLTKSKFIKNPIIGAKGDILYKTGDIAKFSENGEIVYVGRSDYQVKIRGFRIEIGEIESSILNFPGIKETVVIAKDDSNSNKYLAAYYVADQKVSFNLENLKTFLKSILPSYMIPSYFIKMDCFPLTPNGKIDKSNLPVNFGDFTVNPHSTNYSAPDTDIEKQLVDIWKNVLNLGVIGTNDNFFDLGGHSLLLTRIFKSIQELSTKTLTMMDMFKYTTISSLADYITSKETDSQTLKSIQNRMSMQKINLEKQKSLYKKKQGAPPNR